MASRNGDSVCGASTNSIIEVGTDVIAMANMNLTTCSHSISSAADDSSDDSASYEFQMLRRAESFPSAIPPRRPMRSPSNERRLCEHLDDEIDHLKFRQLLLGNQVGDTDIDTAHSNEADEQDVEVDEDQKITPAIGGLALVPPRARISCSSAPAICQGEPRTPTTLRKYTSAPSFRTPQDQRKPGSRPPSVYRHRHRRSFIQEMLNPDSEGSSKSFLMPPKLPSRSESDKSTERCLAGTPVSITSGSQRSNTSATDAPKRPRRSLSPMDGESMRSLLGANYLANANTSPEGAAASVELSHKLSSQKGQEESALDPTLLRKRRQVPTRAKTFSGYCEHPKSVPSPADSCTGLLTKNWQLGRDLHGSSIKSDGEDSLWTATTWPKLRGRVPPGRSSTFSFFVKPYGQNNCVEADATNVASRCP